MNTTSSNAIRTLAATVACWAAASTALAQCAQWMTGPFPSGMLSVSASEVLGSRYIAGGSFSAPTTDGQIAFNIAAWDGINISRLTTGVNASVFALKSFATATTNNLVVGGSFTAAGGISANRIAMWTEGLQPGQPSGWSAMGTGFSGTVQAIERYNGETYAAGLFAFSGSTAVNRIARFNAATQQWAAVGAGLDGPVLALAVYNGELYAGGTFSTAGGVTTGSLARWNGSTWRAVSGVFTGEVKALETFTLSGGTSRLMIGGSFSTPVANLVAWAGDIFVNFGGSGATNGPVYALHATGDRLYAGGEFTIISGRGCGRTAVLNPFQGGGWDPLGAGTDARVSTLCAFNGEIIAGGLFLTAGNISRPRIARWLPNGGPWIAAEPASITACPDAADFRCAAATGYENVTYRWRRNNVALNDGPTGTGSVIQGSGTPNLHIAGAGNADEAEYRCLISITSCGSDFSAPATLTVCAGDRDCNGQTEPADISLFVAQWLMSLEQGTLAADIDGNGLVEPEDVSRFVLTWFDELQNGC